MISISMYRAALYQRMDPVLVSSQKRRDQERKKFLKQSWLIIYWKTGVTLVSSLVSLFSGYCVKPTTAMTGEISLRGQVLPVGGIKEKVISAHRAGIKKIILPHRNRKDVEADVPQSVKDDIKFVYAKTIWDVLESALVIGENTSEKWTARAFESHL